MTLHLNALRFDAQDPTRLAVFWGGLLGWDTATDDGDITLIPHDDTGFRLRFLPTDQPKTVQNQMHLDLTSASMEDQESTVARALELGARHVDIGQLAEEPHVVLVDPEGNEFCVIEPGNDFLADCGFVGAVAGDGSQAAGYFWSAALGWPLVWDEDQETAIRSPHGGPKLTWGGEAPRPRTGRYRLQFDLAPPPGGDRQAEVDRLVSLGATHVGVGHEDVGRAGGTPVLMLDPDGHDLRVLTPRDAVGRSTPAG